MSLAGKVAIVTGATGGIGQQLVATLVDEGARVVITGRSAESCQTLANAHGDNVLALAGDITDTDHCEALVDFTVTQWGQLDLIFNNAGTIPRGTILETTDDMWDSALLVNVTAAFKLSRAGIEQMAKQGGGAIVNTSSMWGLYPGPGHLAYCTAKGALATMTRCMGRDHAADGIRVNAVCPNEVDTLMLREGFEYRGLDPESAVADLNKTVPLGHIASPQEIVDAMVFLASDDARYVTGTVLEVAGGKPVS